MTLWRFDIHFSGPLQDKCIGCEWRKPYPTARRWWFRVFLWRRMLTAYYFPEGLSSGEEAA